MENKSYPRSVEEFIKKGETGIIVKVVNPYNQESLAEGHWKGNLRILVEGVIGNERKKGYMVCCKTENIQGCSAMAADQIVDWLWENVENAQVIRVDLTKIPARENKTESFVMTRE